MIRKTTFLITLFAINLTIAQVFYTEDFETDGNGTRYFPEVENIDGQNDFFARVQDADHTANFTDDYLGESGTFYWAGEDHDDPQVGGSGNQELELLINDINISGRTNIFFSALFGGNALSLAYETADYVIVEYRIDNGAWVPGISFLENGNGQLAQDTNADNLGDGFILNGTMEKLEFSISATGSEVDIRIRAASNSSGEEWAIDLIELSEGSTLSNSNVQLNDEVELYRTNRKGVFRVKSSNALIKSIEVFDLSGKLVIEIKLQNTTSEFTINLSKLETSIYVMKINTNHTFFIKKIYKN
ncbi:MAG: T9SS C-terminal target domain-containing protein [Winogradskyella sp.]|uniref:T9SS type A sorting domain-containing protein n=1 Tax=Winogradskyella sp. TaxID=1883156 RepID=UPI000F4051AB|nr:T9SS type A sorting domain-containing protein [Winogradskyella sp.]RNC87737.1 MAG: T9SS C-terminal target domain-containing protein [Winogradskyella sp.]